MDDTQILPDIGDPVTTNIIDTAAIDSASIGETIYAATVLAKIVAQRMADPAVLHEFSTYTTASGADWAGLQSRPEDTADPEASCHDTLSTRPLPTAPENYCDSLPALGLMFTQMQRSLDVVFANYANVLGSVMEDQTTYLGAPHAETAFRDHKQYLRETMKLSADTAQRHISRGDYLAHRPGSDPNHEANQPKFPKLAAAFTAGKLPTDNVDRFVGMDKDLIKYAEKSGQSTDFKDQVLQALEGSLVEACEDASPEEFSQQKRRWLDRIANEISPDGPSPAEVLAKQADNALRTRGQPDGSGRIWMDATPEVYAKFKNFILHQSNFKGQTPVISPELAELFNTDTTPDLDRTVPVEDPAEIVGEDSEGHPVTAGYMQLIDPMTHGQKLGAMLVGMLNTILSMDPRELGVKKAHGTSAQLVVVQDIETAHKTLGYPPLPPDAQRPQGPDGIHKPIFKLPNPDGAITGQAAASGAFTDRVDPNPWTPYQSEAINSGPIHPADAEILGCDAEISAQMWNGPDIVLQLKRTQRHHTPAQRRAILARDRGCQTPGCTVPATYCDIHHIVPWLFGGNTDETNAVTLCSRHHTAVHLGKWTIRKADGQTFFQPAAWLDPYQPLLRNAYWNI